MSTTPTMTDVAREAGVGVATVDRVINKRAPVKPATMQRVLEAAERIGFKRTNLIRRRAEEPAQGCRMGIILQKRSTQFYADLGEAIVTTATAHEYRNDNVRVVFLEELVPRQIIEQMHRLAQECDVLAIVAADHPLISQAIDQLSQQGIPVIALISDLTAEHCAGYVGLDYRKVGRMAAWTLTKLGPDSGKIGLMIGSHRYQNQEQNEMSFRAYLREFAPEVQVLETVISLEDIPLAKASTVEMLELHPDLGAIYIAGGGIEGVCEALREYQRPQQLIVICMELTAATRVALADGTIDVVLSHPLELAAGRLLKAMKEATSHQGQGSLQHTLPFFTYTAANI